MKTQFLQSAKIILLGLVIGLGVNYIFAAGWSGPSTTPPGNNTPAPVNVSTIAQSKGGIVPTGALFDISGLFTSDRLLVAGDATVGDLSSTANPSATYPSHVCANANGTLELCGTPTTVTGQQVYTISGGVQTSSGDCAICTANPSTFVTPAGVTSLDVVLVGAGGGGGGALHYISNLVTPSACNTVSGCNILIKGSGGGAGGGSTFNVLTAGGFSYNVSVGRGGAGGSSLYQTGITSTSAGDGVRGGDSIFSGSIAGIQTTATATGGGGGQGGDGGVGNHLPGNPPVGNGGSAGYGNVLNGTSGKPGFVQAYLEDIPGSSYFSSFVAGVTTSLGGTNSAPGTYGDGGTGALFSNNTSGGAKGNDGVIIVSWEI